MGMKENTNCDKEAAYGYWLANVKGLGNRMRCMLTDYAGTARAVYEMSEQELKELIPMARVEKVIASKRDWELEKEYRTLSIKGMDFVGWKQSAYPQKLTKIADPPFALYYYGGLPEESLPSVALIGARQCSEYGRYMAKVCGSELAKAGVSVVSGMARGIDGIGQYAALLEGGKSYAVLGCGIDICYPSENRYVYEQMKKKGGIISEYNPGTQPQPQLFPPRNRIISGLADVIIIVEAKEKSGTLITADMALEQGKEVYVIPGRVTDPLSEGCNRLIKQGAGIFSTVSELLEETGLCQKKSGGGGIRLEKGEESTEGRRSEEELDETKRGLLRHLDFYPKNIEQLHMESGIDYRELVCELMHLCVAGKARQVSAGQYQREGL